MFQKKKKRIIISCILLLIFAMGVGSVWAWNLHKVSHANVLQSRTVSVDLVEDFPSNEIVTGEVKKDVDFENTGTVAVFIRFSYAEYWETEDELLEGYTDNVTKNWSSTSTFDTDWSYGGDGWYYYNSVLPAGETIDILSSVTFDENIPEDAGYTLVFQVETLQVSDEEAVNTKSTSEVFGNIGTVSSATYSNGAVVGGNVSWATSVASIVDTSLEISESNSDNAEEVNTP